jgi:hypothetical protein
MDQADMFKGKFDADPSELSAATAVSGHVDDQVAGRHHIIAPARKSSRSERSNVPALSNRGRQHRRPRPIESGSSYYCSLCVAGAFG